MMRNPSKEYELKISLSEETVKRVRTHPILRELGRERAQTRYLRSVYFDTADQRLREAGIALRVRRIGRSWVQTVKSGGALRGGVSTALEDTTAVDDLTPVIAAIGSKKLRRTVEKAIGDAPLLSVFETRFHRTERMVTTPEGAAIEVAIDRGEIVAGEAAIPLCEVELELKGGPPRGVFSLARTLTEGEIVSLAQHHKAALGFLLAEGADLTAKPRHAAPSTLKREMRADTAFAEILRECTAQISQNLPLIAEPLTAEPLDGNAVPHPLAVQQYRIGLRRLRSAFKLFRPMLRRKAIMPVAASAKLLAYHAGALRDADVMLDELISDAALAAAEGVRPQALRKLRTDLSRHRDTLRTTLRRSLIGAEAGPFLFDLVDLSEGETWRAAKKDKLELAARPAKAAARDALDRAAAEVHSYGDRIDALSIEERHDLRKALKTLRYATAFFHPLFEPETVVPYLKALKKLQNRFGALTDAALVETLPTIVPQHRVVGEIIAHYEQVSNAEWVRTRAKWDAFKTVSPYW
ncbi:MAG: CYTH and CHAD domain-containing protein [Pseudomonadota bacterium]